MSDDLRLIEDYLPIEAISAEASREKSVRKGHISTLHLWWARRPLVACRAAVYGALVSADRWVRDLNVKNPSPDPAKAEAFKRDAKRGLNRKAAKDFVTKLCRYPKTKPTKPADIELKRETEAAIVEAQRHILEAHAERLTAELAEAKDSGKPPTWVEEFTFKGQAVTYDDIVAGRAPRPRVLDMFAGGGAIPLEALRLGCEAYALDLNPVAHIIELCTLVYPQKYGKPDPTARGMTGPKNDKGEATWGGLAAEVRYWGNWVLEKVRKEIGDLYPPIPDPEVWKTPPEIAFDRETGQWKVLKAGKLKRGIKPDLLSGGFAVQSEMHDDDEEEGDEDEIAASQENLLPGFLRPVAYLWTRTVRCKRPDCGAIVPLVKQSWLCRKPGRYVAMRIEAPRKGIEKTVRFRIVETDTESKLDFDPGDLSKGGNATCAFCGTVADSAYVKEEGLNRRFDYQPMAIAALRPAKRGKVYLAADGAGSLHVVDSEIPQRLHDLATNSQLTTPSEPIVNDAKGALFCVLYGISDWGAAFSPRQRLCLLSFAKGVHDAEAEMQTLGANDDLRLCMTTYLAAMVDKLADFNSVQCTWNYTGGRGVKNSFSLPTFGMTWDFAETNPFNPAGASWVAIADDIPAAISTLRIVGTIAPVVRRGSAMQLPCLSETIDAVITDPPYYDNVPYADISDFFYVWLKRTVGHLYPDHFSSESTPKKAEVVADAVRHGGDRTVAKHAYEQMMGTTFNEAARVLKPLAELDPKNWTVE